MLCAENALRRPLLYLSLFFKQNRDLYYEHLQRVRTHGEWEEWLAFFLEGVIEVGESAVDTTEKIVRMIESDRAGLASAGRAGFTAARVHGVAVKRVVFTPSLATRETGLSKPTVYAAIERLESASIISEVSGKKRGKVYAYTKYLDLLNEGTSEPA